MKKLKESGKLVKSKEKSDEMKKNLEKEAGEEEKDITMEDDDSSSDVEHLEDVIMEEVEPSEEKLIKDVKTEDLKPDVNKEGNDGNYSVYVANIPYTATEEMIKGHFKKVRDDIQKVSIFTFARGKSKGSCLLEFSKKESYESALKMNFTKFGGRAIKVEQGVKKKKVVDKYTLDLQMKVRKITGGKKKFKRSRWKIKRIPSKTKKIKNS